MDIDVIKEKIAELHRNDEEICVEVHSKKTKIANKTINTIVNTLLFFIVFSPFCIFYVFKI